MKRTFFILHFILLFLSNGIGQTNIAPDSSKNISDANSVNAASNKLLKSIQENKSEEEITLNYFDLAQALSKSGDLSKAEFYMNRAIQLEADSKAKAKLSDYYRELAKIQEAENKKAAASMSYSKAANWANSNELKQLNQNDAARLQNNSPQIQLQYLNQNGAILTNSTNNSEKLQNYTQTANTNIALNNNTVALENFKSALNTVDSNSENSILIKSDMANLMAASKDYENAIALQLQVVAAAENNHSAATQFVQLQNLSNIYLTADSDAAAMRVLESAYKLALTKGNVKQAKESLVALVAYYEKNNEKQKVTELYKSFVSELGPLISRDSSLIDKNMFLITEGKISELEQQQALKDELIQRKNRYNYVLIGSVFLLLTLLLLIIKAWFSIKKGNKQIALQSLRREMNPHFIFNSLNSVNQFIANNNELEANKYLTSYSNLMRNIMENSNKDYVTLSVEVDQLKKYLELEKLRFPDKFDYEVEIDPAINTETLLVPNMLIQPNLENAIWHGLRYKNSKGLLKLKFSKSGAKTIVVIDDNGIGLNESHKIKTKNQKLHDSLGLKNVKERIRLLNDIYKSDIRFEMTEKTGTETGVLVKIEW